MGTCLPSWDYFSDEYVFDVFTFPILKGIGKEALRDPNAIILSNPLFGLAIFKGIVVTELVT
jgi:hypothetical protein